ncbi:MAG: 50S ribosomal protein L11 methyltransferase [Alphaproteobacteria bacterium]|nr:50S ribosomal protein L11 methyltransferase [Alphaproteobacteria bacterium]
MKTSKLTSAKKTSLYRAIVRLPARLQEESARSLLEAFEEGPLSVSLVRESTQSSAPWLADLSFAERPSPEDIAKLLSSVFSSNGLDGFIPETKDISIEEIPADTDWLAQSYRQFPPFEVGPFFVYGSHHKDPPPEDKIALQIDAATAFGSGEHGTTKGCLLAMTELKEAGVCPWNVLDMGTGSGILAIAAWRLWKTPVLAVDNDEEAVRVTARHAALNQVPLNDTGMICETADGFRGTLVQQKRPFDLVIANILAGPLKEMAADLAAVCDDNGYVILSGILTTQAQEVLDAYAKLGLQPRKRTDIGEWSTLVLQNAQA